MKLILPFILVFALYVQFHGDYGPGGGFQAGAISAGGIILYAMIYGVGRAKDVVPEWLVHRMIPAGVLIFAGTGVVSMLQGNSYLNYTGFAKKYLLAHEWGILIVEFGVLVTVSGTLISLFYAFVDRGR